MVDAAESGWQSIARHTRGLLDVAEARLLERAGGIRTMAVGAVERANTRLALVTQQIASRPGAILFSAERNLSVFDARARLLDPVNTMARGWSITRAVDGSTLRSTKQAKEGETLVTTVADGTITSTVTGKDTAN
ncbi:MAG: exodeoxyribonuclease VII large subunit, partial [Actinomycetota bacterium]